MRRLRDYREAPWKLWQIRWYWVCSHNYSHHAWPDCPETHARLSRRRWYGPVSAWSEKRIEYPLRRLLCRLGRCTRACRGRSDHTWIKGAGTRRKVSDDTEGSR